MRFLPSDYGLCLTRLTGGSDRLVWPALVLHSTSMAWPFDADRRPPAPAADGVDRTAGWLGLHQLTDPFAAALPTCDRPWKFHLPTPRCPARLAGPDVTIALSRAPVTPAWWSLAVQRGGRCRLFIATAVSFPPDPAESAYALTAAATAGRVHGATIGVEF